jgi:hypothetical protein
MKRFVMAMTAAVALAVAAGPVRAQSDTGSGSISRSAVAMPAAAGPAAAQADTGSGPMLKPPVFILMAGAISSGYIHCSGCQSQTKANLRFQTVVPTATKYFSLVAGAQFSPQSTGHGAIIFYGGIIPIPGISEATGGVLGISLDPLGVTTGPGSQGTDFVGELAIVASVGTMMAAPENPFHSFFLYALFDQSFTHIPAGASHFTPAIVWGAGLQVAPWGR